MKNKYKIVIQNFISSYEEPEYYIPTALNMLNLCSFIRIQHFDFYNNLKIELEQKYNTELPNYYENTTKNIYSIHQPNTIFRNLAFSKENIINLIKYDKFEEIRKIVCQIDSDLPKFPLNISAYFGSVKCFRYFLLNKVKTDDSLHSYACAGGDYEIIHYVENIFGQKYTNYDLNIAIFYHHDDVADYIAEQYLDEMKIFEDMCISGYNYKAFQLDLKFHL